MKTRTASNRNAAMIIGAAFIILFAISALSSDVAEKVIAEEISGVVVEKGSGKPIPNAIVAIRFERYNTGHGSPYCFRSIATETDANGRFRFKPWTQENTLANSFLGQITAYKAGYDMPQDSKEDIWPARRSFLGIRFSDNLRIPKTERRIELTPRSDTEMDRMETLSRMVSWYACGPVEPDNNKLYVLAIREEILASPLANKPIHATPPSFTWLSSIETMLRNY